MKTTFDNLAPEKRQTFVDAAMQEFAQHNFEQASINRIIQAVGLARGSAYRYFTDKVDLWLYLRQHAEALKTASWPLLDRSAYPSFWGYYYAIFMQWVVFDRQHPSSSQFLLRAGFLENAATLQSHLNGWRGPARVALSELVERERYWGTFRPELETAFIVHHLITTSYSLATYLQDRVPRVDLSGDEPAPLPGSYETQYAKLVHDYVEVLRRALSPVIPY